MSRDPRKTARACFALAARAGTEGEKAAALNRGMAIIEAHKLNPDHFDIPGRARIRGMHADRVIVDDPHAELSPIAEAIVREMMARMMSGGYSTNLGGFNCAGEYRRSETSTQKAEREREERMSAYLKGRGGFR